MEFIKITEDEHELMHYGVLGMHWGKRKYSNADGSLTEKGHKKMAKYNKRISSEREDMSKNRSEIADIKKHGMNSKTMLDEYRKDQRDKEFAEAAGVAYVSKFPKMRAIVDGKGNITGFQGMDAYKVKDLLDSSVESRERDVKYSERIITKLETKKKNLSTK